MITLQLLYKIAKSVSVPALAFGIGMLVLFFARSCQKAPVYNTGPSHTKPLALLPEETLHVSVSRDSLRIATPSRQDFIRQPRHTEISVKKDGTVTVKSRKAGFTMEPAIGVAVANRPLITLDLQLAYWQRVGFIVGTGYQVGEQPRSAFKPYVGFSYDLPFGFTSNTGMFIGLTTKKEPLIGLRVRF